MASKLPRWQKNLRAVWFGNFMTGAGSSMVMPFLPLFISTMGNYPKWELTLYAGAAFSITFLSQALVSPMWGNLADRTGRKPMLIRASVGLTVCSFILGFAPNVWYLIIVRGIQGCFSGYINNAGALIASEVPHSDSGKAMGQLTTGNVGGMLIGPLIGGFLADRFGYRVPFFLFSFMMLLATIVTVLFVKEDFKPIVRKAKSGLKDAFSGIKHKRVVVVMFISATLIQAANTSINPILSLFVKELMHGHGNIAMVSGVVASLPGIATIFAAPFLGSLGDRIGSHKVLTGGLIVCACLFFPMFFVTTVVMLGILRFFVGISDAALLPVTQTVITDETPVRAVGRIFSYYQSFIAMGAVIGPMLASLVAGHWDYRNVFLMTGCLILFDLVLVTWAYHADYAKKAK